MGFCNNAYATIKEVENKGSTTNCKLTISKKDKVTGKYACTFAGWTVFVGNAHLCKPMAGQKIKITNCDVSNGYVDKNGDQKWNTTPRYTVFAYELQGDNSAPTFNAPPPMDFTDISNDTDLPF